MLALFSLRYGGSFPMVGSWTYCVWRDREWGSVGFLRASKEACHEDDSLITPMNLMDLMVVVLVKKKEPFHLFGCIQVISSNQLTIVQVWNNPFLCQETSIWNVEFTALFLEHHAPCSWRNTGCKGELRNYQTNNPETHSRTSCWGESRHLLKISPSRSMCVWRHINEAWLLSVPTTTSRWRRSCWTCLLSALDWISA